MPETDLEIIAECGVNHNGDYNTAVAMMKAAKDCGCDTVKYQLWNSEQVYPRERWDEMKRLELSRDDIVRLKGIAETIGLRFLCTPDDIDDARFLKSIGVERIKIGSSNVTNRLLLREVAGFGVDVIFSTGACVWDEVLSAAACFGNMLNSTLTAMHCVSGYPAPYDQLNLDFIGELRYRLDAVDEVGFSDHTRSSYAALVALGLGARVFEKHLTLDRDQRGPDHAASVEPFEMSNYVLRLRECATMLGDGIKRVMPCEEKNRREYERFVRAQYE